LRYRFLTAADAPILAEWAANNPQIPVEDAKSLKNHPTCEAIAIEEGGEILLILPFFAVMQIPFFGWNPEADARKRVKAMNFALGVMEKFAVEHHVHGIQGFSRPQYPMAQWSVKHGFQAEDRQAFVKVLPREVNQSV
jgi:hypothetical protein